MFFILYISSILSSLNIIFNDSMLMRVISFKCREIKPYPFQY